MICLLLLAFHGAAAVLVAVSYLSFPFQTHHWGEWDVLYQSILASRGTLPYLLGDLTQATSIPYQFLFPYLCALPVLVFGPELWIGRAISMVSFAISAVLIIRILRRYRLPRKARFIGIILVAVIPAATQYSLFKFHPNALCIALGMLSLALIPRRGTPLSWAPAFAAAIASFFAKQTGIVFLTALSISALWQFKWRAAFLIAPVAAVIAGISLTLNHFSQGTYGFFSYQLPSHFNLRPSQVDDGIRFLLGNAPVLFSAAIPMLSRRRALRDPVMVAAAVSIPVSIYSFAMWGGTATNFSICFILLAIPATRFAAVFWRRNQHSPLGSMAALALLLVQLTVPLTSLSLPDSDDSAAARKVGQYFADDSTSVLALDEQHWAFLSGNPLYTNAEAMLQFKQAGIQHYPVIETMIQSRSFDIVTVGATRFHPDSEEPGLRVFQLLLSHYCVHDIVTSNSVVSPLLVLHPQDMACPEHFGRRWLGRHGAHVHLPTTAMRLCECVEAKSD